MSDIPITPDELPLAAPIDTPRDDSLPEIVQQPPRRGSGWLRCVLLTLLSMVAVTLALGLFWPKMTATEEVRGVAGPARLPWVFNHEGPGNKLTVRLKAGWFTPQRWLVIPDDNLRYININNKSVPLADVRPGGLQDYTNGFEIDLGEFMEPGRNEIVFNVDNGGGGGGIVFRPLLGVWRWLVIGAAFLPMLFGLGRVFRLGASQYFILILALGVICAYWSATPWQMRSHDVGNANGDSGHIDYIIWVATNLAVPKPMEGWTFYHPPLYYMLGAAVWRWAQWLSLPGPESIQALSLACWLIFLTASAGALRLVKRAGGASLFLATLALAFWPSGIIHSIRIGNDAPLYATSGLALWFAVRWWQGRRLGDVAAMAVCCGLALLFKSNAIVLLAGCGLLVASEAIRRKRWKRCARNVLVFGAISACGLAASFGVRLYYFFRGEILDWLISNVGNLSSGLTVPVQLKYFLPLDIPTFLTTAWMNPWDDASGRANFWNYMLRSALSGEFSFLGSTTQRVIAFIWGGILLALCAVFVARLCRKVELRKLYRFLPWIVFAGLWVASLMAVRIKIPYSCSNDFRYIIPVLVPAVLFWANAGRLSRWLLFAMSVSSAVFFFSF